MSVADGTVNHCPCLAFDARISGQPGHVELEWGEDVIAISGPRPAEVLLALGEMRGDRTVDQIVATTGLDRNLVASLSARLQAAGVLEFRPHGQDEAATGDIISPERMIAVLESYYTKWKNRVFSGPLWISLADGTASRSVFLGWLIESYFFIEAATGRFPVAVAGCQVQEARRILAKHFTEEYDHHHFFAKGLIAAGIDLAEIARREPLPGTMAVRNHMRHCGRTDTLAYAACSGFLESTGNDHVRAHEFFDRLTRNFDKDDGRIIAPMAAHARLDESYQHCGVFREVIRTLGPVTRARAEAALEAARILVETLEVWSTDILRHYADDRALKGGVRRYRPLELEERSHG